MTNVNYGTSKTITEEINNMKQLTVGELLNFFNIIKESKFWFF